MDNHNIEIVQTVSRYGGVEPRYYDPDLEQFEQEEEPLKESPYMLTSCHFLKDKSTGLYRCQFCAYRSMHRSSIKSHLAVHSSARPFACGMCSYEAKRLNDLRKHWMIKHGKRLATRSRGYSLHTQSLRLENRDSFHTGIQAENKSTNGEHTSFDTHASYSHSSDLDQSPLSEVRQKQQQKPWASSLPGSELAHLDITGSDAISAQFEDGDMELVDADGDEENEVDDITGLSVSTSSDPELNSDEVSIKMEPSVNVSDSQQGQNSGLSKTDLELYSCKTDGDETSCESAISAARDGKNSDRSCVAHQNTVSNKTDIVGNHERKTGVENTLQSSYNFCAKPLNEINDLMQTSTTSSGFHRAPPLRVRPQVSVVRSNEIGGSAAVSNTGYTSGISKRNATTSTTRGWLCEHCQIQFFDNAIYFMHMGLHDKEQPWKCTVCGVLSHDVYSFTSHFVNGHASSCN